MDVTLIFLAVVFALSRGTAEGMDMIMSGDKRCMTKNGGVRSHEWFQWYHAIEVVAYVSFALFAVALVQFGYLWEWAFNAGLFFLGWQLFENAYWFSRDGRLHGDSEFVTLLDIGNLRYRFRGWSLFFLHALRIVAAITLLTI